PRLARKSIGFRPNLSAAYPQIGEKTADNIKVIPKAIPEYCSINSVLSTPRCLIKRGNTGATWLIPTPVTNIPNQQTIKFLFQIGISIGLPTLLDFRNSSVKIYP